MIPRLVIGALILMVALACAETHVVVRVLDGDTVEVQQGDARLKIRLIGVNTPETDSKMPCERRWAIAARELTAGMTLGQPVRLEADVDVVDKFGRMLRYVYLPQSGGEGELFLNAYLLQGGYAWVGDMGRNVRFRPVFRLLEAEAKAARRGLWAD